MVSVKDAAGDAQYDILRPAPTCAKPSIFCDSGSLLVGRRQLGPEPHYPNTVNGSCPDGVGSVPRTTARTTASESVTLDGRRSPRGSG